ncbi:MAG: hypothetical protein SFX72_12135 [Isosphaeraceae bacterium]|nr:hypothetical protein [Isosphaeraceae bacterium]
MVKALAPSSIRGSSWVGLWFVISAWIACPVFAQTGEPKSASTPPPPQAKEESKPATKAAPAQTKEAAKAAPANEAAKPSDPPAAAEEPADDGPKRDSGEIFKDPRAEKFLPNTFVQLPYPAPRPTQNDMNAVKAMVAGQTAIDRGLLSRYVDMQVAELTNHTNIRALIDPPPGQSPNSAAARAVERAVDALVTPIVVARSNQPPNTAFLAAYLPLLQSKVPPLLDNHLIARTQGAIVLGTVGTPALVDLYIKQLADPNQVLWVKLWAARGLTEATQSGRVILDIERAYKAAAALIGIIENEADLPWPVQIRLLEAVGANRQASMNALDRKADVLSILCEVLTEPESRPDVRAWAAWALSMLELGSSIPKVNYPLLTYHIGELAASIGDRIGAEYDTLQGRFEKNKGPASYLTGLLVGQIEPALAGSANVRNSGILGSAHPSAEANRPFAQSVLTQVRAVGKAAVELMRAGGNLQIEARKNLAARVSELRGVLQKGMPKDVELTPGGLKLPIGSAPVADARPAK